MRQTGSKQSAFTTWIFIIILAFYFVMYSLFTFVIVGDQGPPDWDFGIVKDVPGSSPQAIYKKLPYPQHVEGGKNEFTDFLLRDGRGNR